MSKENHLANIYICAVWLVVSNRTEADTIRFWSQNLDIPIGILSNAIKQCNRCKKALHGDPCTNPAINSTWNILSSWSKDEIKLLLNNSRKNENE